MKRLLLLGLFIFSTAIALAQTTTHAVNGETLELRTDIDGTLSLLWNTFDQEYRYFIRKDNTFTELVNEKKDNKYTDSYKAQLSALTSDFPVNTDKVKLTLASLRKFTNTYNTKADPNYTANSTVVKPSFRLGGFVGITNSIYTSNPDNISNPQVGIDFEILDSQALPRHSFVVQYKQTLSSDDFDYSASQFSLNYRFKFIKTDRIDVFLNTKLATYTSARTEDIETVVDDQIFITEGTSGGSFQGPFLFGLGADIALGNGYLMLNYHDAYSFFLDDNGEFPVDFSIGYKFNL
jgi:hypothetical protein